jgi:glycerol uptake facilitator-like aquaporin
MDNKYILEFIGVVTIVFCELYTHGNPLIMGFIYAVALSIAHGVSTGHFNPLSTTARFILGHLSRQDAMYNLLAQFLAMNAVVITFKGFHVSTA